MTGELAGETLKQVIVGARGPYDIYLSTPDSVKRSYRFTNLPAGQYDLFVFDKKTRLLILGIWLKQDRIRELKFVDLSGSEAISIYPYEGALKIRREGRLFKTFQQIYDEIAKAKEHGDIDKELSFYSRKYDTGKQSYQDVRRSLSKSSARGGRSFSGDLDVVLVAGSDSSVGVLYAFRDEYLVLDYFANEGGRWRKIDGDQVVLNLTALLRALGLPSLGSVHYFVFDIAGGFVRIQVDAEKTTTVPKITVLKPPLQGARYP